MEKIWKYIPWYNKKFKISIFWNVVNTIKWVEIKQGTNSHWYVKVTLDWKKKALHRLVAQAFLWLDIDNKKIFVCHKDDDITNNTADNLFLWDVTINNRDSIKKWRSAAQKAKKAFIKKCPHLLSKYDNCNDYDDGLNYL